MSEVTSHSRVRSVASSPGSTLATAAGAVLAAVLAAALSRAVREVVQACGDSLAETGPMPSLHSPAAVRAARPGAAGRAARQVAAGSLEALDAAKARALTATLGVPLAVADPAGVRAAVERVAAARDVATADAAGAALVRELDRQHVLVVQRVLVEACSQASVAAGFKEVETSRHGGLARVVALDGAGHALVSEVRIDAAGVPAIETEALGWTDRSCQNVLDQFDRDLIARGVRSDPPLRHGTGGAARLSSSRELEKEAAADPGLSGAPARGVSRRERLARRSRGSSR